MRMHTTCAIADIMCTASQSKCRVNVHCSQMCNVVHSASLMCSTRYISDVQCTLMQCTFICDAVHYTATAHIVTAHIYNAMTSVIELHRYTNCSAQFATNDVYDRIVPTRRLTTSLSPRAPPCRSVSPASRETRCAAFLIHC